MANPEHVAKLKLGWQAWNEWRKTGEENPDLSFIHLLHDSLNFYDLNGVDLSDSRLMGVSFVGTLCVNVSFERAFIFNAIFQSGSLTQSSFR